MKKIVLIVSIALSCILTFAAGDSVAQIGLRGIGGKVALVMPENEADTTFGLGVVADLGDIMPQLNLEAGADYWGDSWEIFGLETSWSTITIGGTAKYHFPMDSNISPFAGGGVALSISRWKSEWKGATPYYGYGYGAGESMSDSDMDIGFHAVLGADMPIGSNMKFTAEAKYAIDGCNALWLSGAILVQLY